MKTNSHIKSFVKRSGRITNIQKYFLNNREANNSFYTPRSLIDISKLFNNDNPCILDVGFGDGKLLINIAKKCPEFNFIGLEVYDSGIGNILKQISNNEIENIKILKIDAIVFLEKFIRNSSLYGISLFFPDPWPKKKHYKRRLINENFLNLISDKVQKGGFVKIATDWPSYNESIVELFERNKRFHKTSDIVIYNERILTKFEKRGILLGHKIFDLTFKVN
tara:strand:+ start:1548 stop:2213 length:666 start_codon:yes stop_codon:yes gene_type:complete